MSIQNLKAYCLEELGKVERQLAECRSNLNSLLATQQSLQSDLNCILEIEELKGTEDVGTIPSGTTPGSD
jgi:protein subunit release factor A